MFTFHWKKKRKKYSQQNIRYISCLCVVLLAKNSKLCCQIVRKINTFFCWSNWIVENKLRRITNQIKRFEILYKYIVFVYNLFLSLNIKDSNYLVVLDHFFFFILFIYLMKTKKLITFFLPFVANIYRILRNRPSCLQKIIYTFMEEAKIYNELSNNPNKREFQWNIWLNIDWSC